MKFIGYKHGKFNDPKSGNEIEYARIYCTDVRPDVSGLVALELKVDLKSGVEDSIIKIPFGTDVKVYYDQSQRVNLIVPAEPVPDKK